MVDINKFSQELVCNFKDRTYSVRDNGSVYRHQKEGSRPAPLDNKWTFGKKDEKTGYMMIAGVRVHQIVATAFHGVPEYPTMVVDHIDTNRCNNRPENLRWLTRLENVLNNPYTRSRIAFLCGSVEAFLKDPSILRQTASEPNTSWMRTVSKEEAARCLKWLDKWNKEDNPTPKSSSEPKKGIGDWIYTDKPNDGFGQSWDSDWESREPRKSYAQQRAEIEAETIRYEEEQLALKDSLTSGAKQLHWKTPTEFPLCPQSHTDTPLQDYLRTLIEGETFCKNQYYHSEVLKAEISLDQNHIAVITTTSGVTNYALTEVKYDSGNYIHESIRTFFSEEGAEKYYTLSLGKVWTGGDVMEDFC